MKMKEKASPGRLEPNRSSINVQISKCERDKGTKNIYNNLSKRQKKVYDLLCTGKHSVADIENVKSLGEVIQSDFRNLFEKGGQYD